MGDARGSARRGYCHVVVDGERNDNAAWFYPRPKPAAAEIAGRVSFQGIEVER